MYGIVNSYDIFPSSFFAYIFYLISHARRWKVKLNHNHSTKSMSPRLHIEICTSLYVCAFNFLYSVKNNNWLRTLPTVTVYILRSFEWLGHRAKHLQSLCTELHSDQSSPFHTAGSSLNLHHSAKNYESCYVAPFMCSNSCQSLCLCISLS